MLQRAVFAVHLTELSSLQNSVSIVSEKLNVFLDANERSLGIRQNTENNTDEDDLSFKQRGQRGNRRRYANGRALKTEDKCSSMERTTIFEEARLLI